MCSRLSYQWDWSLSQTLRPSSLAYQWTCFISCILSTAATGSVRKKNHPEFDILLLTIQPQGSPCTIACAVESHLSGLFLLWCLQLVLSTEAGISRVLAAQPAFGSDMASCSFIQQQWLFLLYDLLHMSGMCLPQALAITVPLATQQLLYFFCSVVSEWSPS